MVLDCMVVSNSVSLLSKHVQVLAFKSTGPKFKCVCGSGFDFQDDMEVHQVSVFSQADPVNLSLDS